MIGLSLHKAAAISLLIHASLILFTLSMPKSAVTPPRVYHVDIIVPKAQKAIKVAKKTPEAPKIVKKKAPAKPAPNKIRKKHAIPAVKEDPKLNDYISKKLEDLKAKKKDEQYKENRMSRIESLRDIRQRASALGDQMDEGAKLKVLDEYYRRIQDRILEVWVFPKIDMKNLEATISLTVMPNGEVIINRFERPSGNKLFDRSALKAIHRASPLEPPPFGEGIEVGVNFIPELRK
jgi:colicin import membrane protein